jgi:aminopeptidase N
VYQRGALTLYALRSTIGAAAFDDVLRRWVAERGGGTATTDDFVALAEAVSGQELDALFAEWLYEPDLPLFP